MDDFVGTPEPPYYAVIFTSLLSIDTDGYAETARRMGELAARQPGYLGLESAREDGFGITVSYWRDEGSIRAWKADLEHQQAQRQGRDVWYRGYVTRVARVERSYGVLSTQQIEASQALSGPTERQRDSWIRNAPAWIRSVREGHIASRQETDRAMVDAVLSRQPRRVLDLGCGEGWLCRALADQGIECIGIDASRELVEAAHEQGGGRFIELDYASLNGLTEEIGEAGFDIVVANFSLLDDAIEATLDQIIPALGAHGQLLVQTLHPWVMQEGQSYRSGWREEDFRSLSVDFPVSMPWFYRTMSDWVGCLARAGFQLAEIIEPACPDSGQPLSLLMAYRVAK